MRYYFNFITADNPFGHRLDLSEGGAEGISHPRGIHEVLVVVANPCLFTAPCLNAL
jgi:hypothetical protein